MGETGPWSGAHCCPSGREDPWQKDCGHICLAFSWFLLQARQDPGPGLSLLWASQQKHILGLGSAPCMEKTWSSRFCLHGGQESPMLLTPPRTSIPTFSFSGSSCRKLHGSLDQWFAWFNHQFLGSFLWILRQTRLTMSYRVYDSWQSTTDTIQL